MELVDVGSVGEQFEDGDGRGGRGRQAVQRIDQFMRETRHYLRDDVTCHAACDHALNMESLQKYSIHHNFSFFVFCECYELTINCGHCEAINKTLV